MRPSISIRGFVRPLVGPLVRWSVCDAFVKNAWNWEFYVQKWSRRHSKPWITSKQLSRISTTRGGYCRTQISSLHLSHLYMRICPKMLEDASLAAGPCYGKYGRSNFATIYSRTLSKQCLRDKLTTNFKNMFKIIYYISLKTLIESLAKMRHIFWIVFQAGFLITNFQHPGSF